MRDGSYSYSPSPPRDYGKRRCSPCSRGRGRDLPTSLLIHNLRHDCRLQYLRGPFGQFGRLKDIYLPRDYYTGMECKSALWQSLQITEVLTLLQLSHSNKRRTLGITTTITGPKRGLVFVATNGVSLSFESSFYYLVVITIESNMNDSGFSWKCKRPGHLVEDCLVTAPEQTNILMLRKITRKTFAIGFFTMAVPFILTLCSSILWMHFIDPNVEKIDKLLAIAEAESILSFPIIAYFLSELRIINSDFGRVAL
ncbi:hypothetical protein CRYUN_Cryun40dG0038700 [Craigia yunnanensis]